MIRIFVGLTLLLALSLDFQERLSQYDFGRRIMDSLPDGLRNLVPAAIIVITFLTWSSVRKRLPTVIPGIRLLTAGIVTYVVFVLSGPALSYLAAKVFDAHWMGWAFVLYFGTMGSPLKIAAQTFLLLGALRLFARLPLAHSNEGVDARNAG